MTESELSALLDAHDVLLKSCLDSTLTFEEFLALYNAFPHTYALDRHRATADERAVLRRSQRRIAFHFQVAGVLTGITSADPMRPYGDAARFVPEAALMRLGALVRRYPDFGAEPDNL